MRIFQTIVKKIFTSGGGSSFIASVVGAGVKMTNIFSLTAAQNKVGVSVTQSPTTVSGQEVGVGIASALIGATGDVTTPVNAGVAISSAPGALAAESHPVDIGVATLAGISEAIGTRKNIGIASALLGATGDAITANTPALKLTEVLTAIPVPPKLPAFTSKLSSLTLSKRTGGNAVTETAVAGRTDWASDANAISGTNGLHDGLNATFAGNALGARAGQLEISYANHLAKDRLRITSAKLHFYGSVAATLANNADVQLKWDNGAGTFVTLETITGNADFSVTPKTHDITASFSSWSGYDGLRAAVSANAAALETWTATLDAVEIEIVAEYKYIEDLSDNLRDGAVLGRVIPTITADGVVFDGVDRDDASQGVMVGAPADTVFSIKGRSAWTIDCKYKAADAVSKFVATRANGNTVANFDWAFQQLSNGTNNNLRFLWYNAAGTLITLVSPVDLAPGTEYHMRVKFNGSVVTIEKNGTVVATSAATSMNATPTATIPTLLGRGGYSNIASHPQASFNGSIKEFRFSDIARSDGAGPYAKDANTLCLIRPQAILP